MRKVYTKRYSNILGPDQNAKSSGTYKSSPKSLVLVQSAVMNDREPRASERGAFCMEGMNRFSSLQGHADGRTDASYTSMRGRDTYMRMRAWGSLPPSFPTSLPSWRNGSSDSSPALAHSGIISLSSYRRI